MLSFLKTVFRVDVIEILTTLKHDRVFKWPSNYSGCKLLSFSSDAFEQKVGGCEKFDYNNNNHRLTSFFCL